MNLKRNKLRAMGLKMGFDPSEEVDEALHPNVARNDAINKANAMKAAKERQAKKPSPDVIAARKRQYSAGKPGAAPYTAADKKKVIGSYKEHHEKDANGKVIEHPIEDEKKPVDATPSSVNEEGYDHARDMGMVKPSKDKKDATTMPPSEEMKKLRKVNKGPSALERVKANIKKRGEKIMKV